MGHNQGTPTFIVGQRALLREGLGALLQNTCYKIVASTPRASDLKDFRALAKCRTLVIIGVDEANGNVAEAAENIRLLRSLFPDSKIVMVAEMHGPIDMQQILTLRPNGYIANLGSRDILLKLLELTLLDQQVIVLSQPCPIPSDHAESDKRAISANTTCAGDSRTSSALGTKDPLLSQRERQILLQLVEGDSNKEIARLCKITESTVKVHLKAILRKIPAHNRTQAAIWAVARGYHPIRESSDHPIINQICSLGNRSPVQTPRSDTNSNGVQHLDFKKMRK